MRILTTLIASGLLATAVNAPPAIRAVPSEPRYATTEAYGDLASARRIAVIVPGVGWNPDKLRSDSGRDPSGPVAAAIALSAELGRLDPSTPTVVVVWLGYDPPQGIDVQAARSERAIAGVRPLTRYLQALPAGVPVSLLCHSYGAVVCGRTVASGQPVADLVALAAPGMDVGSAAQLRAAGRVWAARTSDDPIRFTPFVRLAGLGHGADPDRAGFGALRFRTGSAHGHGGYYTPGSESLTNLARIVLGRDGEVSLVDSQRV
jgi:hypothetical protein